MSFFRSLHATFRRLSLPLVASLAAHGSVAAALVVSRAESLPRDASFQERDVWIGDALEIADPTGDSRASDAVLEHAAPPSPAAGLPQARVAAIRPAAPEIPRSNVNRDDSPAARMLARAPKPATVEPNPEGRASTRATARGTIGGTDGVNEQAPARGFAKAFARALPVANSADAIWNQVPLGTIGSVRLTVIVDDDGAIAESRVVDEPRKPPAHLARLVERTMLLLQGGRFALARQGKEHETLRVDVTVSERPTESGPLALGFEAPSPGTPGRAYFQLASGRLVDAKILIEPR